jgi:hypothetical protein
LQSSQEHTLQWATVQELTLLNISRGLFTLSKKSAKMGSDSLLRSKVNLTRFRMTAFSADPDTTIFWNMCAFRAQAGQAGNTGTTWGLKPRRYLEAHGKTARSARNTSSAAR